MSGSPSEAEGMQLLKQHGCATNLMQGALYIKQQHAKMNDTYTYLCSYDMWRESMFSRDRLFE